MDDLISRQAAIDALNEVSEHYTDKGREWHPHVSFMVDAIRDLPSAQPEDYAHGFADGYAQGKKDAQPERKKGKWKDGGMHGDFAWEIDGHGRCWHEWICSECGDWNKSATNFCPNCGADMRGEQK